MLLLQALRQRRLTRSFDFDGAYPYTRMLKNQVLGRNNSWAILWHASCYLAGLLTLYPGRSLVHNIGNDSSGTHTSTTAAELDQIVSLEPVKVERISLIESEVRRAAFAPVLFDEIRKNYGDSVPSDENLRAFLLRKGFTQSAVDAPIRAYRETIGLVNSLPKMENEEVLDNDEEPTVDTQTQQQQKPDAKRPPLGGVALANGKQVGSAIPVTPNCSMTIIADGDVTQEGLERLVTYIDLIKTWFPANDKSN